MNFKEYSISALVDYFVSGCKKEKLLGLELEHFVVDKQSRRSVPYTDGIERLLNRLQPLYGEPIFSDSHHIIGVTRETANITLEPAAQLEISIMPSSDLSEIARIYYEFIKILTPLLDEMGFELVCLGYHPKSKIDELPLIPKQRYEHMYSHFAKTGTRGKYMMKGSAATQVNIDYESETDFKKKFRVANILGPLLAFICDNAIFFEGEPFTMNMVRTFIWDDVDPARSGVPQSALDRDFGFRDYAEYIYNMPEIFLPEDKAEYLEHALTMAFPDVRLKTRLELRMADSMPIEAAMDFMTLLSDIFYNEVRLNEFYQATVDIKNSDVAAAKNELIRKGKDAIVYGRSTNEWLSKIWPSGGKYERFKHALRGNNPQ